MTWRFDSGIVVPYTPAVVRRIALLAGLLAVGPAFAQEAPRAPTLRPGTDIAAVLAADAAKYTPAQKKARTEVMLKEMRDALLRATEVLGEAREAKDIVQLNCVNEKLTQIKGLLKISEKASVKMYEGLAQGTDDAVNHEFTKLSVAHQKVLILRAETDQCVGESTIYTGETEVEVEVEGQLAEGDPTASSEPSLAPSTPTVASGS